MSNGTGDVPPVLVIDDHDEPQLYLMLGEGHYPVKQVYHDSGKLVVVLDFHALFRAVRAYILSQRPSSGGPSPDPGTP